MSQFFRFKKLSYPEESQGIRPDSPVFMSGMRIPGFREGRFIDIFTVPA